jgi:hypothetical protein
MLQQEDFHDIFQVPLYEEAYVQYCEIDILLQSVHDNVEKDQWKYIKGSGHFSVKKAYNQLIGT